MIGARTVKRNGKVVMNDAWEVILVYELENFLFLAIHARYPQSIDRSKINILVPGCGLGRFNYDLMQDGFSVCGNEFSFFMILASNYMLNFCQEVGFKLFFILNCSFRSKSTQFTRICLNFQMFGPMKMHWSRWNFRTVLQRQVLIKSDQTISVCVPETLLAFMGLNRTCSTVLWQFSFWTQPRTPLNTWESFTEYWNPAAVGSVLAL